MEVLPGPAPADLPGGYFLIAVDYLRVDERWDPQLLKRLRAQARRVTIAEGTEPVAIPLTLTKD